MSDEFEKACVERIVSGYEFQTPTDVADRCPVLWRAAKEMFPGIDFIDLAGVMGLMLDACPECKTQLGPCHCWNDE